MTQNLTFDKGRTINKIAIKDMFYNYYTDGCGLHPNTPNSTKKGGMINAEKVLKEDKHEKIIL